MGLSTWRYNGFEKGFFDRIGEKVAGYVLSVAKKV